MQSLLYAAPVAALLAATTVAPAFAQEVPDASSQLYVKVTWYAATGNRMRNGQWPYIGAAACGDWIAPAPPKGGYGAVVYFPDQDETYYCTDTGYLGHFQIDIFGDSSAPARLNGSLAIIH